MLAAVLLLCLASTQVLGACVVNTTLGAIRGTAMTSRGGREFCSYRAVPYAQPPVGDLRYKPPVPVSPWTDELNGTAEGPVCPQPDPQTKVAVGQEDCLYLSVYTPQVPGPLDKPVAVMFYIHGGGLVVGSGVEYGPKFLLDKDVILVTINYRLGILGFLSTGDDVLPGNYGFKDMLLALQWTAQNIAAFGGDPGRVTIQGESSGSVAVHLLMLSPQSSGLFWAAIGESNTALVPRFAPPDDPMILVHEVADAFNCSDDNATSIVDCLKQLDALDMAIGQPPYHLWTVVVENQTESNPEPFLTATPMQIVLSGDFANIPWLMGHNSEEGADSFGANIMQQSGLDKVNSDFDSLSTNLFLNLSVSEDMVQEIWQRIADFYLGDNHTITLDNVLQLMHVYSDRYMAHQTHKANILHTKAGKFPIYKYLFDYQGRNASEQLYYSNGTLARVGALHVDELLYLFNFESADIDWPEGHPDLETSRALVTLWTNFAAYCNPTPADADIPQGVQWPPIARNASHVTYYKISQAIPPVGYNVTPLTLSVQQDLYKDRMDFWDSLPLKENQGQ